MAIALSGVVMIDDDGQMMRYQKKCENCGALQPGTVYTQATQGSNTTLQSSFMCFKCGRQSDIRIRGE